MGLFDFVKGELLEIIEWTDDSRDTLSYPPCPWPWACATVQAASGKALKSCKKKG